MSSKPVTVQFVNDGVMSQTSTLLLDGQDITSFVRHISLDLGVGDVANIQIDVLARAGFDFQFCADAVVNVVALPGFEVVRTEEAGAVHWRAVKIVDDDPS